MIKNCGYLFLVLIFGISCIQNYPNEYKPEVNNVCACMENRKVFRNPNLSPEVSSVIDDDDYKICITDVIINRINPKGKEFTAAINDLCPQLKEVHARYVEEI